MIRKTASTEVLPRRLNRRWRLCAHVGHAGPFKDTVSGRSRVMRRSSSRAIRFHASRRPNLVLRLTFRIRAGSPLAPVACSEQLKEALLASQSETRPAFFLRCVRSINSCSIACWQTSSQNRNPAPQSSTIGDRIPDWMAETRFPTPPWVLTSCVRASSFAPERR